MTISPSRWGVELADIRNPRGAYCIKSVGDRYWKIGVTKDVRNRLAGLDEAAPFPIELVFFMSWDDSRAVDLSEHMNVVGPQGAEYFEKRLQSMLAEWGSHREWFRVDRRDERHVETVVWWQVGDSAQDVIFGDGWQARLRRSAQLARKAPGSARKTSGSHP